MTSEGALYRTSRDGVSKHAAFLDDYAFFIQALLALYISTTDPRWKAEAQQCAGVMTRKFADPKAGGFYFTESGATDLIVRQKVASDSPLPSGNAVAAMSLLMLGHREQARDTIGLFSQQLMTNGESMSSLVQAAIEYLQTNPPFTVSGDRSAPLEERPLSPDQIAAAIVSLKAEWISPQLLSLRVSIVSPFHINAHEASAGLLATQLSITGPAAASVKSIDYPAGEEQHLPFADQPLHTYHGQVMISVQFTSPPPKNSLLQLALRYQACNEDACFPPATKILETTAA